MSNLKNSDFIFEGVVTDIKKGYYDKFLKKWTLEWTAEGLSGPWKTDAIIDSPETMTFYSRGTRYKITKKWLRVGGRVKVFGHRLANGDHYEYEYEFIMVGEKQ